MSKAQFAADVADEQLDTVTRAVMASSHGLRALP
jgi:hypothetical protein